MPTVTLGTFSTAQINRFVARHGTAAAAIAYIKKLVADDQNKWEDQQADAAAVAARVAPTLIDPASITGGGVA